MSDTCLIEIDKILIITEPQDHRPWGFSEDEIPTRKVRWIDFEGRDCPIMLEENRYEEIKKEILAQGKL